MLKTIKVVMVSTKTLEVKIEVPDDQFPELNETEKEFLKDKCNQTETKWEIYSVEYPR